MARQPHAPPSLTARGSTRHRWGRWKTGGSRSASSLPPFAGGGLHGDLQTTENTHNKHHQGQLGCSPLGFKSVLPRSVPFLLQILLLPPPLRLARVSTITCNQKQKPHKLKEKSMFRFCSNLGSVQNLDSVLLNLFLRFVLPLVQMASELLTVGELLWWLRVLRLVSRGREEKRE